MHIAEALSFVVMMVLALYGLAKGMEGLKARLLCPRHCRLSLLLELDETTRDTEYQVRAAQYVSRQTALPLIITDDALAIDQRKIVDALIKNGVGERCGAFSSEKTD